MGATVAPPTATLATAEVNQMTAEELSSVYCALVRHFHPDWRAIDGLPGTDGATSMFRLWEAHQALAEAHVLPLLRPVGKDAGIVTRHLDQLRPPNLDECMFCGSTPARLTTFTHQEALFVDRHLVPVTGSMCRPCGSAIGRRKQRKTMRTGWWGLRSAFINVGVLVTNGRELGKLRRVGAPSFRDPRVISLLRSPVDGYARLENPRGLVP